MFTLLEGSYLKSGITVSPATIPEKALAIVISAAFISNLAAFEFPFNNPSITPSLRLLIKELLNVVG